MQYTKFTICIQTPLHLPSFYKNIPGPGVEPGSLATCRLDRRNHAAGAPALPGLIHIILALIAHPTL